MIKIYKKCQFQTDEEYGAMNGYRKEGKMVGKTFLRPYNAQIPEKIDWRKEGFVTPVKDQVKK